MQNLTILFDPNCALCAHAKRWIERRESYVGIEFVPAGTKAAAARFPELDAESTLAQLTVVADERDVYRGDRAFLICLWALRATRSWAVRMAERGEGALARRFFEAVSRNRHLTPAWFLSEP